MTVKLSCGKEHTIFHGMFNYPVYRIPCYSDPEVVTPSEELSIETHLLKVHEMVRETEIDNGVEYYYFRESL